MSFVDERRDDENAHERLDDESRGAEELAARVILDVAAVGSSAEHSR